MRKVLPTGASEVDRALDNLTHVLREIGAIA
jgi:hypothetical protein